MDPAKTNIIFGPPGTGKTTTLLRIVEGFLEESYQPHEIAFIAFTRKAANEARERACLKFKLESHDLPWFRTLHSMAFTQLGITRAQVMSIRDYIKLAELLGVSITFKYSEDGTIQGLSRGDRLFFLENMSRMCCRSLRAQWELSPDEDIHFYELERVAKTIEKYKQVNGKRDFTDMVGDFVSGANVPPVRALIVDEAQDLSSLQWRMIEKIAEVAEETHVAGDDDQAIFRWAGADVDHLINLQGSRTILPHSYRVPQEVQSLASQVIAKCSHRVAKAWEPREGHGSVTYVTDLSQVDMSKGTWLLLARNIYLLNQYVEHCLQCGIVFESVTDETDKGALLRAIRYWEALRRGERVTAQCCIEVYDQVSSRVGVAHGFKSLLSKIPENTPLSMVDLKQRFGLLTDKVWHEALDRIPAQMREYFIAAIKGGEKLTQGARVKINTIHGVKGAEADCVVLVTDIAQRTLLAYHECPDDEHRVFYVAVTRAREKLFIVQPRTPVHYEI